MRDVKRIVALLIITAGMPLQGFSQSNPHLEAFFRQSIGLTEDQIAAIRNGQAIANAVPSRIPDEIFLFGAVYIHAAPEAYQRINRSRGCCKSFGFQSPERTDDHQEYFRK